MERIPFEPVKKKKRVVPQGTGSQSQVGKSQVGENKTANSAKSLNKDKSVKKANSNVSDSGSNKLKFKPTNALTNRRQNNQNNSQAKPQNKVNSTPIPKIVSDRMVRRSALFCGTPTGLGFAILIASYVVVSRHLFELPNTPVLLLSLGLTGVGVLGLSYGALSASWDENRLGSWWGGDEFQKNFGYLTAALKNQNAIQRIKNESSGKSSKQDLD